MSPIALLLFGAGTVAAVALSRKAMAKNGSKIRLPTPPPAPKSTIVKQKIAADIKATASKRKEASTKAVNAIKPKSGEKMHSPSEKLSKNFIAREFLVSNVAGPELQKWDIPETVWNNLSRLANLILQPARDALGVPLQVTSGWRPPDFQKNGKDFYTLLKEAGYQPSIDSDHMYGLACGLIPRVKVADRLAKGKELYSILVKNPNTRQVILYLKTNKQGTLMYSHIHVAVKSKMRKNVLSSDRSFVKINGKRSSLTV